MSLISQSGYHNIYLPAGTRWREIMEIYEKTARISGYRRPAAVFRIQSDRTAMASRSGPGAGPWPVTGGFSGLTIPMRKGGGDSSLR